MEQNKERFAAFGDERENAWRVRLRASYDNVAHEPLPDRFLELMAQLDEVEPKRAPTDRSAS